jgi:hypothetical protein
MTYFSGYEKKSPEMEQQAGETGTGFCGYYVFAASCFSSSPLLLFIARATAIPLTHTQRCPLPGYVCQI